MGYRIELKRSAEKAFEQLPRADQERVAAKIDALAGDPRPFKAEPLKGNQTGLWRVRSGDYRIIYTVQDDVLLVCVINVGHRREVYR